MKNETIAIETYDLTLSNLSPTLPDAVRRPPKDPHHFKKEETDIVKTRLLPTERAPASFWSATWCFYEIGIGSYGIGRANFGGVQFVMFPDNQVCGGGAYRRGVTGVLDGLNPGRRRGFFCEPNGGSTGAAILCGFRYCLGAFTEFPMETAADDLAWLIKNTLRQFAALG
jgi:hypothetical protein